MYIYLSGIKSNFKHYKLICYEYEYTQVSRDLYISGTHWSYEICNMIRTGSSDFMDKLVPIFDYSSKEQLRNAQATS